MVRHVVCAQLFECALLLPRLLLLTTVTCAASRQAARYQLN